MKKKQFIKKAVYIFLTVFFLLPLYSQDSVVAAQAEHEVPLLLEGVWKNYSRYVVFDTGFSGFDGQPAMQEVLRIFYAGYDDRAAESSSYTQENPRDVNDATPRASAEEITVNFHPLTEQLFTREYNLDVVDENGTVFYAVDEPSGAWDLEIKYPHRKETYHVPVCVIGKNLYLDFAVKTNSFTDSKNELYGFFKDEGHASGILISPPYFSKELTCYYVTDDAVYTLRYWRTDMDYDEEKTATFSDKGDVYQVPAHLRAGGNTYTCVNGRGTKIRNITKGSSFPKEYRANRVAIEHSSPDAESETQVTVTGTIVAFGKPYLTLVPDSAKIEDIIAEDKKRKRPEREPLFPPHGVLDFDWSVVPQKLEDRFKRNLD